MSKRPSSGIIVVLAMFALGGAILWAFFHAARTMPRIAPATTQAP